MCGSVGIGTQKRKSNFSLTCYLSHSKYKAEFSLSLQNGVGWYLSLSMPGLANLP